jgi:GTPase SAR1 family protein
MPEAAAPYKIILAGMKGVGKTSLFNLLQYNVSEPENEILRTTDSGISSRGRNKITIKTTCFDKPVTVRPLNKYIIYIILYSTCIKDECMI